MELSLNWNPNSVITDPSLPIMCTLQNADRCHFKYDQKIKISTIHIAAEWILNGECQSIDLDILVDLIITYKKGFIKLLGVPLTPTKPTGYKYNIFFKNGLVLLQIWPKNITYIMCKQFLAIFEVAPFWTWHKNYALHIKRYWWASVIKSCSNKQ